MALSRTAEALEDPDLVILTEGQDSFVNGVPVGFGEISWVPQVFARKEKWRKLDESEPDFDRANYKSAEMSSEELLNKFRDEEDECILLEDCFHGSDSKSRWRSAAHPRCNPRSSSE